MITTIPANCADELDLNGRKYPVIRTIAVLMVPSLLFWAAAITFAVNLLHHHGALLGAK
jgi:hypothetical protein